MPGEHPEGDGAALEGIVVAIEVIDAMIPTFGCSRKEAAARAIRKELVERVRKWDSEKQYEHVYSLPF